jgi:hypothetical protein
MDIAKPNSARPSRAPAGADAGLAASSPDCSRGALPTLPMMPYP